MIDLYSWATPNGHKVSIMLEELGAEYRVHPVDIGNGEQLAPDYLALNPNGKIPTIVDEEGPGGGSFTVFESGAILVYLAEKSGSPLLPAEARGRSLVLQWLMFQMGGLGPMLGQAQHFRRFAPQPVPYAIERYTQEAARLYAVLDRRLGQSEFLAGAYSIADVAAFPWVARHDWQGVAFESYPNVRRWAETIRQRPAVQRGMLVPQL